MKKAIIFLIFSATLLCSQEIYYKFIYNKQFRQVELIGVIFNVGSISEHQYNNYTWVEIKSNNEIIYALCETYNYNLALKERGKKNRFILLKYKHTYYLQNFYPID